MSILKNWSGEIRVIPTGADKDPASRTPERIEAEKKRKAEIRAQRQQKAQVIAQAIEAKQEIEMEGVSADLDPEQARKGRVNAMIRSRLAVIRTLREPPETSEDPAILAAVKMLDEQHEARKLAKV